MKKQVWWNVYMKISIFTATGSFLFIICSLPFIKYIKYFPENIRYCIGGVWMLLAVVGTIMLYLIISFMETKTRIKLDEKYLTSPTLKVLIRSFKKVSVLFGKKIALKTESNKTIGTMDCSFLSWFQIQQILTELQKRGKIVEIEPLLDGVFITLEPLQQQKNNRHLEV